ncbi:hypothetical protein HK405_002323, partial [Cladochytrium tenue]
NGNEHVIRMLLEAAADPRAWDVANADGLRPVHAAYIHRPMDAVKILLEDGAADPACNADRMKSMTPVHLAAMAGSTATLTRLLHPPRDPTAPAADFDSAGRCTSAFYSPMGPLRTRLAPSASRRSSSPRGVTTLTSYGCCWTTALSLGTMVGWFSVL